MAVVREEINWFLVAIGADKKNLMAPKLAMYLTTVGDDAVKVFEAFIYDEGAHPLSASTSSFASSGSTVRPYETSPTSVSCSGNTSRRQAKVSTSIRYAPAPSGEILQPLFGKTCATTQKNVKSHVFLDFEKKRKKT